jgi:hypothetical protein
MSKIVSGVDISWRTEKDIENEVILNSIKCFLSGTVTNGTISKQQLYIRNVITSASCHTSNLSFRKVSEILGVNRKKVSKLVSSLTSSSTTVSGAVTEGEGGEMERERDDSDERGGFLNLEDAEEQRNVDENMIDRKIRILVFTIPLHISMIRCTENIYKFTLHGKQTKCSRSLNYT